MSPDRPMKQPRVLPPLFAAMAFVALTSVAWIAWAQSSSEADDPVEITQELEKLLGDVRAQQRLIIQKLKGIEERLRQLKRSGDGPVTTDTEPSGGAEEPPEPATAAKQPESTSAKVHALTYASHGVTIHHIPS